MEGIEHKTVSANGLNIHIAQKGEGPLVLLLHGFPELWYSWRHQILYLADHGYRAVAPDLRGFGETTGAPVNDHTKFTIHHLVGDVIGLLDAITNEGEKVFVVGHDWGASIAWHLGMFRPDRVKGLVNLSVPTFRRNPDANVVEMMRAAYGEDHYITRFQKPGDIEDELAKLGDTPVTLPPWLAEEDIDYYANQLQKTGWSGGINYYRALHLNWELTAAWHGAKVTVPSKFIIGDQDLVYHVPFVKDYILGDSFKQDVPLLEEVIVMKDVAHWINQEKPHEISKSIFEFLQKF
uniref:Bifunctional epoxide hydrolase 2-like n=1 Tax=Tanacetum cinerariifolium TaxID=118510 RepID=A0A6L2LNC7_TANCI|nr:bifunctional epoxide hydrolase 2-like [Tanacetum cinerariifolium]